MSDLIHQYQALLVTIGVAVVASEAVVRSLQLLTVTLRKLAAMTSTKIDDEAAGKLSDALQVVSNGLAFVERWLPRGALGKADASRSTTVPPKAG